MRRTFGYARVSTLKQDVSLEVQQSVILGYYDWALKGTHAPPIFFCDKVTGDVPFRERESGKSLWYQLQPGDALLISKLDRGFRNMRDMVNSIHDLDQKQVHLHVLDMRLDTSTPTGRLMLGVLGFVSEFERNRLIERCRESIQMRRKLGTYVNRPKYGYKHAGPPRKRRKVPNQADRDLGALIVRLKDEEGYSFQKIQLYLMKEGIRRNSGMRIRSKNISYGAVFNYYHAEKALRLTEGHTRINEETHRGNAQG